MAIPPLVRCITLLVFPFCAPTPLSAAVELEERHPTILPKDPLKAAPADCNAPPRWRKRTIAYLVISCLLIALALILFFWGRSEHSAERRKKRLIEKYSAPKA